MPEEITLLPVREFPDRGTKWLLESPENTTCAKTKSCVAFCLLRIVDINLAECIDFKRLQHLPTIFIPDNLRKQEADVEARRENLKETLLRISGAIQVVEEMLAQANQARTMPTIQQTPTIRR